MHKQACPHANALPENSREVTRVRFALEADGYQASNTLEVYADPQCDGVYAVKDVDLDYTMIVYVNAPKEQKVEECEFGAWPPCACAR